MNCTVEETKSPEKISSGNVARRDLTAALKLGFEGLVGCYSSNLVTVILFLG
jgi:hypothetical protein